MSVSEWASVIDAIQTAQQETEAEAIKIGEFPSRVQRLSDSVLTLVPRQGSPLELRDVWNEEQHRFARYRFIGRVPRSDAFLVQRATGHDTFEYLLTWESTGDTMTVDQPPAFSPSGGRFLTASACFEISVCPVRIQVYTRDSGHFVLEQTIDTRPWGALNPDWLDESTVRFTKREPVLRDPYDLESPQYRDSDGELRFVDGRWRYQLARR